MSQNARVSPAKYSRAPSSSSMTKPTGSPRYRVVSPAAFQSPAEWSAVVIVTLQPGGLDGAALVHADDLVRAARQLPGQPQAQLVDARPGRTQPRRERDGHSPKWSKWPWLTRSRSQRSMVVGVARAGRVGEPRVEDDRPAAGGHDLEAAVAVPRDGRVSVGSPIGVPPSVCPVDASGAATLAGCPPRRSPRTSPSSTGRS